MIVCNNLYLAIPDIQCIPDPIPVPKPAPMEDSSLPRVVFDLETTGLGRYKHFIIHCVKT